MTPETISCIERSLITGCLTVESTHGKSYHIFEGWAIHCHLGPCQRWKQRRGNSFQILEVWSPRLLSRDSLSSPVLKLIKITIVTATVLAIGRFLSFLKVLQQE